MNKDKKTLSILTILTITLALGLFAWARMDFRNNVLSTKGIITYTIPVLLVVFMIFFIIRRSRDIKGGLPLKDERSKQIERKAASTSFYLTLYWLLALSMFESFFAKVLFNAQTLDAGQTTGGAIGGMAIFFFITWIYYQKSGDNKRV